MTEKRKIFLLIYALIILVVLIYILFIAPSDLFLDKKTKEFIKNIEQAQEEAQKAPLSTYFEHIKNNNYSYTYNILDSVNNENTIYICKGIINGTKESGSCSKPKEIQYDETNKKDKLDKINLDLLDIDFIIEKVEEETPEVQDYNSLKLYKFTTKIDTLDTDILIYANKYDIEQIQILNGYEDYVIKYSNINY